MGPHASLAPPIDRLADHAPVMIRVCDTDGRCTWCNPQWLAFTDRNMEQELGDGWQQGIHPDDLDRYRRAQAEAYAERGPFTLDYRLKRRDGMYRWVTDTAAPMEEEGRFLGYMAACLDITERKAIELQLIDREERFIRFMEHLPGHAWIKDGEGRYMFVNEGVGLALGLPRAAILGRTDRDLFSPDQAQLHLQSDAQVRATGRSVESVDRMRHASEEMHHALVSKFLIPDVAGGEPLIGGIAIDITDRHRADLERRETQARFELLADNMEQLAWIHDVASGTNWFNRRFHAYTGLTPEEVAVDGGLSHVHPDHVERVMAARAAAHAKGEGWEETFLLRGADGAYRWFLLRAIAVKDEDGRVKQWFGTNTDINTQKDAEERLHEADRRKNEFLATLAHELRNPLAPLRTALDLLELGPPEPDTLRLMDRQLHHLVHLIDDLLDVGRISRGTIALRRTPVDLRNAVQLAVAAVRQAMEQRRHELLVQVPEGPVQVDGDVVRLTQVLSNLLHNSAKYTPDGGRVQVTLAVDATHAILQVQDNGMGIPAEMLPRVFDMFTQVDRSPARTNGGLGIGLNIVQRLVELHGGTVEARSEGIDKGSTFRVRIPLGQ